MTGFWVAAGALALGALAFLLVPLWRHRRQSGRWSIAGVLAAALVIPSAVGLYLSISTWDGVTTSGDTGLPAVAELVEGLAERLRQNPEDPTGWRLLGQSYVSMGLYPQALQAFREAWSRTPMPDPGLRVALAEALALNDPVTLTGEAGQLFAEVLAVEPRNEKALWYGGLAALHTGATDLARERWSALLEIGVPEAVEQVLREQIEALGGEIATAARGAGSASEPVAAPGFELNVQVRIGDSVAAPEFGPNAALFIFARAPEGGPPLAVIRGSVDAVPGEFVLSDANAMLPGRSLADFPVLTLVARLSTSGQPIASPGDLFGELDYEPSGNAGAAELVIDQIVP